MVVKDQSTKIPLLTGNACQESNLGYFYKEAAGETHRTIRAVRAPNEFGRGPVKVLYDRSLPWTDDIKYFMFLQIVG